MALRSILSHPLTRGLDLDSPQTTSVRRRLIDQKSFLRQFYQDCYRLVAHSMATGIEGPILELGSGGGFIKEHFPDCITSEIQQVSAVDIVLDGQQLPFSDIALAGIVMLDVFHHVPRATSLLQEATRCIRPGGKVVMFEPWNTRWSRFVYQNLHHEPFDPACAQWELPEGGPMSMANSALPWIVFERDRRRFDTLFPKWRIEKIQLQAPFRYLLSGGVAYKDQFMTIKIPPQNIFDKILNLFGKERKIIVPSEAGKIYDELGPYVQIKAKRENFFIALFRR